MANFIGRNPDKKFLPYQRMAIAIVEVAKAKSGCSPQDLLEKGFTHKEVHEQWHMAHAIAEIEMKLMKNI